MSSGVSYEFSAKTVEAAIEEGLRQLRIGREEAEIEVLHEGSRGLLGIGSTNARVRITLPPKPEPASAAPSGLETAKEEAAMHVPAREEAEPPSRVEAADPAIEAEYDHVGREEEQETSAAGPIAAEVDVVERKEVEEYEEYDEDEVYGEGDVEEVAELAADLLSQLLDHMGFEPDIEVSWPEGEENGAVTLNILGQDLGILIGRHGETLASIQYLVRLMVNQRLHRWANIVVDVDGYKERRAEQLAQMAQRLADQVIQTGRAVALEPMPANERRLVHIALRDHPGVYTESTGEADRRKVQILPK